MLKRFQCVLLLVISFFITESAIASSQVHVVALFNGKAMLSVDGKKARIIKVGESLSGVTLLSSSTEEAVIEVAGEQQTLQLNSTVLLSKSLGTSVPESARTSAQLWADQTGFFRADGKINGEDVNFIVDTGATTVVLSGAVASRIGLEYKSGQPTFAVTASGTTPMYRIDLERISVEGIVLRDIEAGVIEGQYPPIPLLGMSFLRRLEMSRSGNQMTLKKRY